MKRILFFGIALTAFVLNYPGGNSGYAKDISESDVKRIEAEAKKKTIESRKLQAQALQLNLELSKIDKTVIGLAQKIQNLSLIHISEPTRH